MDILQYAINMELDGEKYYREQAEKNKGNELHGLCNWLAEEEKRHAGILENKINKVTYRLIDSDLFLSFPNIYSDAKDIETEGQRDSNQLAFYRIAADTEKNSIDLYEKFLKEAKEDEKEIFQYLIKQEKQHYEVFEELSRILTNAEQWIESPEFGRREEEY